VRIVAATHRDLEKNVADGKFREDLYYRLNVIPIKLPALKDRREDIPQLVSHFIERICEEYGVPAKKTTPDAMRGLQEVNWTGNIRELRNVVERLIILSKKLKFSLKLVSLLILIPLLLFKTCHRERLLLLLLCL